MYCWLFDSTNSGTAIAKPTTSCLIWREVIISYCLKALLPNCYRSTKVEMFYCSVLPHRFKLENCEIHCKISTCQGVKVRGQTRNHPGILLENGCCWTVFSIVVWLRYSRLRKWVTPLKGSFTHPRDPPIISIIPERKHFQWNSAIKKLRSHVNCFLYLAKQKKAGYTFFWSGWFRLDTEVKYTFNGEITILKHISSPKDIRKK